MSQTEPAPSPERAPPVAPPASDNSTGLNPPSYSANITLAQMTDVRYLSPPFAIVLNCFVPRYFQFIRETLANMQLAEVVQTRIQELVVPALLALWRSVSVKNGFFQT